MSKNNEIDPKIAAAFAETTSALEKESQPDVVDGYDPVPRAFELPAPRYTVERQDMVNIPVGSVALKGDITS
jgi:hypothetical protein